MLRHIRSLTAPKTIGMSIECDALRIAESCGGRIRQCAEHFYPAGMHPSSPAFPQFLREHLQAFLPRLHHVPIWVSDGLPGLQARYLLLPPRVTRGALSDMVYWTFRKDLPFDTAQTLFDYDVEMRAGTSTNGKTHVLAYTVPRQEVEALGSLLSRAQLHPTGVIIPPFAMHNLVRLQGAIGSGAQLCVFAGADATTLLVTRDGSMQFCRVFKTGIHALLAIVAADFSHDTQTQAFQRIGNALATPEPDYFSKQIREVVDRFLQQIELSLAVYMNEHAGEAVDGLHLMGAIAGIQPFAALLEEHIGVALQHLALPDVSFAHAGDAHHELSPDTWPDRMALAVGAAMSQQDKMPNLLRTRREREHLAKQTQRSALAVLLAALVVALLHLAHSICQHTNVQLQRQLDAEQQRLAAYTPRMDQPMLANMTQKAIADGFLLKRMAAHWLPFALFRPIVEEMRPDIYLTELTYTATGGNTAARGSRQQLASAPATLTLRGVVQGDTAVQRAKLASLAMRLEDTHLIASVQTINMQEGTGENAGALTFSIEAELIVLPAMLQPSGKEVQP